MTILYIINNGYEAGGAEKSVLLLKKYYESQGHTIHIVSTDRNKNDPTFFADTVFPTISGPLVTKLVNRAWSRSNYRSLAKLCKNIKPDIVHIHTMSEFSPSVFKLGKKYKVLFTVHGPEEFITELYPWLLPATDYSQNDFNPNGLRLSGYLRILYYRFVQRPIYLHGLKYVQVIIAPSKFMAAVLKKELPDKNVKQIYNGIDNHVQSALPEKKNVRLLYAGRLEPVKGVNILLEAFAKLESYTHVDKLIIVGEGSEKNKLIKLSRKLNVDSRVEFMGWLDADRLLLEIEKASIVVIPSVWPENLPTVGIESLCVGRPIIGSNIGGIPEIVENNKNGILTAAGDVAALSMAIALLVGDRILLHKMARATADKTLIFDSKTFTDTLSTLYKDLV